MNEITPLKPSFILGYWRPWKDDANYFESYLNYIRDTSLVKYGADTIGKYINEASEEQVTAINKLGRNIGHEMNVLSRQIFNLKENIVTGMENISEQISTNTNMLSNQLSDISWELKFINRKNDILIEQQKLSNLLLEDISKLLRVPDSEKERQRSIELGIKFYVNAQKDSDLFEDALEELLKAEQLMKQDYFVLHRIGMIYLYAEKQIDPSKALDYFIKAAKYASVESDPKALRLIKALGIASDWPKNKTTNTLNDIQHLVADSYEKASFTSYVLGDFDLAVKYQTKALKCNKTTQNYFLLAKYQARAKQISDCINSLNEAINASPTMALGVFQEIDLMNEPEVLSLIEAKNIEIDNNIDKLIKKLAGTDSSEAKDSINQLEAVKSHSYDKKIIEYRKRTKLYKDIDDFIILIKNTFYSSSIESHLEKLINELINSKEQTYENMQSIYYKVQKIYDEKKLKIGSKYAGGIVFFIDDSGKHGMVFAEKELGHAFWAEKNEFGGIGQLDTNTNLGSGKRNTKVILDELSWHNPFSLYSLPILDLMDLLDNKFLSKKHYSDICDMHHNKYLEYIDFSEDRTLIAATSNKKIPVSTAARKCSELDHNGYKDWFLPSIDELREIDKQIKEKKITNFNNDSNYYWSSTQVRMKIKLNSAENTEVYTDSAYSYNFAQGDDSQIDMKATCQVIAIREF